MAKAEKGLRPIDAVMRALNNNRKCVELPAWGGLKLYFPTLTTSALIAVDERLGTPGEGENPSARKHRRNILLVISLAQLEDGSQAFDFGDEPVLTQRADYATMQQLIVAMFSSAMPASVDEAKSDSGTIKS
jgi:hypothetical protein